MISSGHIGLKSNLRTLCMENRLKYNPSTLEFHLDEKDLENTEKLINWIQFVKSKGINVYLHHPSMHRNGYLDIISRDQEMIDFYDWSTDLLLRICKQENVKMIIHAHYTNTESSDASDANKIALLKDRIRSFQHIGGDYLLWENSIEGIFSFQNECFLSDIVDPLHLKLCFDISHAFIALKGDNQRLKEALDCSKPHIHYYHVVDSIGAVHDGLPLGHGSINWKMVKPYLKDKDYIFEIDLRSSNYEDCMPMIESAGYLANLRVDE